MNTDPRFKRAYVIMSQFKLLLLHRKLALLLISTVALAVAISLNFHRGHAAPATTRPELVMQTGHAMRVDTIAFSPDGQLIATASADNTVKLWDAATRREVRTLGGHARGVKAVAFSSDGHTLASGSIDGNVKLWDTATGRELRNLAGNGSVTALTFSADGRTLAAGNFEGKAKLWDASAGSELRNLAGQAGAITALAFSPDGKLLATGGADKSIKLWDAATGREQKTLTGHTDRINSLAFSPDSQLIASGGADKAVKLWKANGGREQKSLSGTGKILSVAFSTDGRTLTAASANKSVKSWDVADGRETHAMSPLASDDDVLEAINAVFSPDGRWLASSTGDKTVELRDVATGRDVEKLTTHSYGVAAISFSPNGKWFASGGKENTVKLWETATGREVRTLDPNGGFVNTVAFSPDNRLLASGSLSGAIVLWDVESGQKMKTLAGHSESVNSLAFSPDARVLASASADQTVKLWDITTGREARTLSGHTGEVYALAISADGKLIATGGADKSIKLWDAASGNQLLTLNGHEGEVTAIVFSPDAKWLASSSADKTVKMWDAATGREVKTLSGHNAAIKALALSPDGQRLATGSRDNTVKLWDAATGREMQTLSGHTGEIYSVAFTPDGHWLSSAGDDGSARIWDAQAGALAATLCSLRESSAGLAAARTDWLVVAPDGLFDGSPAAWNQIIWRFDGNTASVRPVEVFFNEFFYPGLLADILAGKKPKAPQDIAQVDRRQPRVSITLAGAPSNASVTTRDLAVKIEVAEAPPDGEHQAGSGARDVRLFRNGSLVRVWRGDVLQSKGGKTVLETTIPLVAGENQLTAYAFNQNNIKSADADLSLTGAESLKRAATAYILAVGVNTYANAGYNLKFAVQDAQDFSEEVRRSQQSLLGRFSNIEVVSLMDQQATKANFLLALSRLAGAELPAGAPAEFSKLKLAQPEDTVVIYFAGHGLAHQSRFYLLPHDLGYTGSRRRLNEAGFQMILDHSISDRELEQAFERVGAGQILLVLDACNSGQALEAEEKRLGPMNSKGMAQLAYEKGIYILTAAQSYQAALEVTEFGHGLLTYALIEEGLKKALADNSPRDGRVLLQEWLDYATARVPELQQSKMRQGRGTGTDVSFVEGDEQLRDVEKRALQRPRVFYRRDTPIPLIAIKQGAQASN